MAPDPALGGTPADEPPAGRWLRPVRDTGTAATPGLDELEQLAAHARERVAQVRLWLPQIEEAVFDCYLGNLAAQLDPHTEADQIGVLATLLGAAGAHLGPGPHLQLGYERHPLLIWPMLIGQTGVGKKGTAYNAVKALLSFTDNDFVAQNIHSGLSSGEGLASVFAADTEPGKAGRKPRLLPDGDCRLLAYEPEWGTVMARMRREGNTLSATLRAAWEGGNLSTLNVDARVARQSHISISAHITPKEFREKVSAADMAGGTYNRFLPIAVAQSKLLDTPTPADPALMLQLGAALFDRLRDAGGVGPVGFTDAGALAWRRLYIEFASRDGDTETPVEEFVSRAAPHCLRIAAIYALLDRADRIGPAHLASAAALVRYSIASAAAVLCPDDAVATLARFIAEAGPEGRTKRDITQKFSKNKTATERYRHALEVLTETGRVRVLKRPRADGRPGRATEVYLIEPGTPGTLGT